MLAVKLLSLFYLMSLRAISYELSCIPAVKILTNSHILTKSSCFISNIQVYIIMFDIVKKRCSIPEQLESNFFLEFQFQSIFVFNGLYNLPLT